MDIVLQKHYPFEFYQADALEYVAEHGKEFDAIHASPPCQAYSWAAKRWQKKWPDMVAETRAGLEENEVPWVIENVIGAPLRFAIVLCGTMFGLKVIRHRVFESSEWLWQPEHPRHEGSVGNGDFVTVAGHGGESKDYTLAGWREAMGIDWMDKTELTQAVPPTYTTYIGAQLMRVLQHG